MCQALDPDIAVGPPFLKLVTPTLNIYFRAQSLKREQKRPSELHGKVAQSAEVMIQPFVKIFTFLLQSLFL